MKKRIGFVALLVALAAATAFAATKISFSTGYLGSSDPYYNPSSYDSGNSAITVNWVQTSSAAFGKTNVRINYTVNAAVESMLLCCKVTSPTPKFGVHNKFTNSERLISKGKTYTADMGTTSQTVNAVEVWIENLKMKK